MSIGDLAKLLGHSCVTITERYYDKWDKQKEELLETRFAQAFAA
jgi:hypothetical protein